MNFRRTVLWPVPCRVFPYYTKLVSLAFLYLLIFENNQDRKINHFQYEFKAPRVSANFHWNWFCFQLFPISFHYKLYKNVKVVSFVYYGKTRVSGLISVPSVTLQWIHYVIKLHSLSFYMVMKFVCDLWLLLNYIAIMFLRRDLWSNDTWYTVNK